MCRGSRGSRIPLTKGNNGAARESQLALLHVDRFHILFDKVETKHCIVLDSINKFKWQRHRSSNKRHISLE